MDLAFQTSPPTGAWTACWTASVILDSETAGAGKTGALKSATSPSTRAACDECICAAKLPLQVLLDQRRSECGAAALTNVGDRRYLGQGPGQCRRLGVLREQCAGAQKRQAGANRQRTKLANWSHALKLRPRQAPHK